MIVLRTLLDVKFFSKVKFPLLRIFCQILFHFLI